MATDRESEGARTEGRNPPAGEGQEIDHTDYRRLLAEWKSAHADRELKPTKIAILSDYTTNNVKEPLAYLLALRGFDAQIRFGGYDQYNQELRDPGSWLYEWKPDIVVLALSAKTLFPELPFELVEKGGKAMLATCEEKVRLLLESVTACTLPSKRVLTLLERLTYSPYGLLDAQMDDGVDAIVRACNEELRAYAGKHPETALLDFDRVCAEVGKGRVTDWNLYYLGRILLSPEAAARLARELSAIVSASYGNIKKVMVVDLDNTLWKGVIGEDGIDGIEMGDTTIGRIYRDVQRVLRNLQRTGTVLAIVSKNNEEDVEPAFADGSDMLLKRDDFVNMKINWKEKSENIKQIAKELNLGLDSFVFLDDNPAERAEVAARLPMVEVLDFPRDVSELPAMLEDLDLFKTISLTAEDRKRHEMYLQEQKRAALQKSVSKEDYLKGLGIRIEVKRDDADSIERITQLTNKTNQFNLRTQRYTKEQVRRMLDSDEHIITSVRVWDKFGELGLTGVIILERKAPKRYFIDTFLMSCRVLSRGVEREFFQRTVAMLEPDARINAEYLKTPKNSLCASFYDELGFALDEASDERKTYKLDLKRHKPEDVGWIEVIGNADVTDK